MKTKTVYQCEFCLTEYKTSQEAYGCEASCLKLTMKEYAEYLDLLKEEKNAFRQASCAMNNEIIERCDNAVKAVIDFQKKYNFKDNR